MITYAGLARLVAVAAGVLSTALPPGHVASRVLVAVLRELRALRDSEDLAALVEKQTHPRAVDGKGFNLWQHSCGAASSGRKDADSPPVYCWNCGGETATWHPLYTFSPK